MKVGVEKPDYNYLHKPMKENLTPKLMNNREKASFHAKNQRNASLRHEPVFGGKTATSAFIYRLVIIIPAVTKYAAACPLNTLRHGVRFINAHT